MSYGCCCLGPLQQAVLSLPCSSRARTLWTGELLGQFSAYGGVSLCCCCMSLYMAVVLVILKNVSKETFFKRFYLFLDREEGREKEGERNINVWLPLTHPLLGTWPATQACALMGNWTGNQLAHRPALNPLSHSSRSSKDTFLLESHVVSSWSK